MKQINGTTHYYITENGEIFSDKKVPKFRIKGELHLVKPKINNQGRYFIGIYNQPSKKEWFSIPRLVYKHYVGEIPEGYTIDHKDMDKSNNNFTNLEAVTLGENIRRYHQNKKNNGETN